MNKIVMAASSSYDEKYFIEKSFTELPSEIIKIVKEICICTAYKTRGVFSIGFYENGFLFFESCGDENKGYDEIGAQLEIKKLQKEEKELIKSLQLWFLVYRTVEGNSIKSNLLDNLKSNE
jgi:hypothetical protein